MEIIEKFICGKSKEKCEDGIFYNDDFIAVIDGVTSKGKKLWDDLTSGEYAKNIIMAQLGKQKKEISAEKMINNLNSSLYEAYYNKIDVNDRENYLRATIIIYSNYYKEIWSFGDCMCMINNSTYTHSKKIDFLNSEMRSFAIEYFLKNGIKEEQIIKEDLARNLILPFLKMQQYFENNDSEYGYSVLNGQSIDVSKIKKYKVQKNDTIILASDGYPKLFSNLSDTEKYLGKVLKEDPLCYKQNKSTKCLMKDNFSFDDRSYIKFKI